MSDYKKIDNYYFKNTSKPLGQGACGTVYKAYDTAKDCKEVAVKVISAEKLIEGEEMFAREVEILYQIKGDHIVHLLDVKRTTNNFYIFTELCNGGDLETLLRNSGRVGEAKALEFIYQFSKAFNTINDLEIKNSLGRKVVLMHRDIKPANIFFHDDMLKVADFGFAKLIDDSLKNVKMHHSLLGTPLYMAPQILNDEPYTSKCDVWSAGMVLYESIFGKLPWTGTSLSNLYKNIKGKKLKFPEKIASETKDLLKKMLQINEEKRISWKEIENHPAVNIMGKLWEAKRAVRLERLNPKITPAILGTVQNGAFSGSMGIQQEPQETRTPLFTLPQITSPRNSSSEEATTQ